MKANFIFLVLLLGFQNVLAQEEKKSADDIARELSNPVSSTASLTLQGTYAAWGGSMEGASDQHSSSLIFMPSLPFKLGKYNLSVRPSFPVAAAPYLNEGGNWDLKRGFGDIGLLGLLGSSTENGFLYAIGPTLFAPTASSSLLGKQQWQAGPAALAGVIKKWGVIGILWQHWWGFGEKDGVDKVNVGTAQLFYWFSAGKGWQVGGSPVTTANYVAGTDIDFVVPLNLGVAKTVMAGNLPIKFTVQGQYFATQPDVLGQKWGIFFQVVPVVNLPW